jgi:hypothetical protein
MRLPQGSPQAQDKAALLTLEDKSRSGQVKKFVVTNLGRPGCHNNFPPPDR